MLWWCRRMWVCVVMLPALLQVGRGAGLRSFEELEPFPRAVTYSVDSSVLVNDVARRDRDVGYRLRAELSVEPVWRQGDAHYLLKFVLSSVGLHMRTKAVNAEFKPRPSAWDSYSSEWFASWRQGRVEAVYLPEGPQRTLDHDNYERSLVSLFQFQVLDGEYQNETDISGSCDVLYESISIDVIRKIKHRCVWEGAESGAGAAGQVSVRRVQRVELGLGLRGVQAASAEDEWTAGREGGVGLRLRAWTRLQQRDAKPATPATEGSLEDAIPAGLTPQALPLRAPPPATDKRSVREAVRAAREALVDAEEAGGWGEARGAAALLDLLPALRAASTEELLAELEHADNTHILTGLVRALGVAGTTNTHAAARAHLQLPRHPARPAALHYLQALANAHTAHEGVVLDLLTLASEARHDDVTQSALLAAAAAARTPRAAAAARLHITKDLANCKEDACRVARLHALGSLGRADTVELLLQHAGAGLAGGEAARAALQALGSVAARLPGALSEDHLSRLVRIVLALDAPARLETRAAALDVLLPTAAELSARLRLTLLPFPLHELAAGLALPGAPAELRRYMWQRLYALTPRYPAVRAHVQRVLTATPLLNHHYHPGTSSVLVRSAGQGGGGVAERWAVRLDSAQLASRGVLRAGQVRLEAVTPDNTSLPIVDIELWARGLAALAGADPEEGEDEEEASAGLRLAVGGARALGVTLFSGQAELLGAVWSGAGSEPTPALRAALELGAYSSRAPLCAGLVASLSWRALLTLALDAHATVSLWGRTARTGVALRAAAALQARANVTAPWVQLHGEARADAEPRLHIDSDLDFYDKVALCVRTDVHDFQYRRNVTLEGRAAGRGLRRQTMQGAPARGGGRTLALGPDNDLACRDLVH